MLTRAHRQEAISRAYLQAVAARCGLLCGFRDFDYGIDYTLHQVSEQERRYFESGVNLDLQLRSTPQAERHDSDCLYDVDIPTYNRLRISRAPTPRILVVVVLPSDETE